MRIVFVMAMSLALSTVSQVASYSGDKKPNETTNTQKQVAIPEDGIAVLRPTKGNQVRGIIRLTQTDKGVRLRGRVQGLTPGKHGFHIHEYGDLSSPDGKSAGGHYAPKGHKHGGPEAAEHHAGDLGNIVADDNGIAQVDKMSNDLKLHFVVGRAIVVHAKMDDLKSQPSGDAGPRVAYGVIGYAEPMAEK